jgi:hypothetical protein
MLSSQRMAWKDADSALREARYPGRESWGKISLPAPPGPAASADRRAEPN